jgi:AAA+ ATPase superfamily predicted ATPase
MFRRYFPKGIAKGSAFFNRTEELKRLNNNLKHGTHTVLIGPRRYGKSSLAKHAIAQLDYQSCEIDLFVATADIDVANKIIAGVSTIIQQLTNDRTPWFDTLKNFLAQADKKWTVGFKGLKLELIPHDIQTVPQNILEALEALELILKQHNKSAVIYIDEFQEILDSPSAKAIEGAIRHFAQDTDHVVFIFSGSSRKMLKTLFNDRARPLYALCDEIHIDRISALHYENYLRDVSSKSFQKAFSKETISRILQLSDRHPRYVYLLCTEIWIRSDKQLPSTEDVDIAWHEYVMQKYKDVRNELSMRSGVQIKLLTEISAGNNTNLSSQKNQMILGLTSSAIVQALQVLERLDYIEREVSGTYRIIDPLIKSALLYAYSRQERLLCSRTSPQLA